MPASTHPGTPEGTRPVRETVALWLDAVVNGTRDDLADFYAHDIVLTNRFAPDGVPGTTHGNEELRTRMKGMSQQLHYDAVEDVSVHETTDPETVVVEFAVTGSITKTGTRFKLSFINVMRIVDGLITESRDYADSVRAAKLFEEIAAA